MDKPVDKVDNAPHRNSKRESRPALTVFAKQPCPGTVKTRFCPPLRPDEAAELYTTALQETVERLSSAPCSLLICYVGDRAWFDRTFPGMHLLSQGDGDLGHRLTTTSKALFKSGSGPLLLVGSDSPDLPLEIVTEALSALAQADVVITPCQDGGYAMIGLRQAQPELFEQIPWSTAEVLKTTRQRAAELGLDYYETAVWDDLDDLPALHRLLHRSPESQTAQHALRRLVDYL